MLLYFAYIDPSAGFQIFQSTWPIVGMILAFIGILLWPIKHGFLWGWHFFKKHPRFLLAIIGVVILSCLVLFIRSGQKQPWRDYEINRVIVLGMDGLDPLIMERLMRQGELPNFTKLKNQGTYSPLKTVLPPQSPVVWCSFATGLNPGDHGIYDFLWRHKDSYLPDIALAELEPGKAIHIFGRGLPFGKAHYINRRRGKPVWAYTSEAKIPTLVHHCPVTFPPDEVTIAMLSGMGVPDIRGTQGTFTLYSDGLSDNQYGDDKYVPVEIEGGAIYTVIKGPFGPSGKRIRCNLDITLNPKLKSVTVKLPNEQTTIKVGQWSPWMRVNFRMDFFSKVPAMTRFYLKSLSPHFELYASALNFTPEKPVHPISYPHSYARILRDHIGDYHTLGMPHDTWALNEGVMDEGMFLEQSQTILNEEISMLKRELPRFKEGLYIFVITTPDRIQHMFWRAIDKQHPLYTDELSSAYGEVIDNIYRQMDDILGRVMRHVDDKTILMVLSDHGFKSFRRAAHLNSWLRDHGYLVYEDPQAASMGQELFQGVDWTRTRAYAFGFGGIYLNLKGREKDGIVEPGVEASRLKREIADQLIQWRDDASGSAVTKHVYNGTDVYDGVAIEEAPDLVVGFAEGYRASWQTAVGGAPSHLIEDNLRKWSGDHIMDHEIVPGVLFANKKIQKKDPSMYDIAPTILHLFGLPIPERLWGTPLFSRQPVEISRPRDNHSQTSS